MAKQLMARYGLVRPLLSSFDKGFPQAARIKNFSKVGKQIHTHRLMCNVLKLFVDGTISAASEGFSEWFSTNLWKAIAVERLCQKNFHLQIPTIWNLLCYKRRADAARFRILSPRQRHGLDLGGTVFQYSERTA